MDAAEYQANTVLTEMYGNSIHEFTQHAMIIHLWEALRIQYVVLGLAGEAGEISNKVKKEIRDNPRSPFGTEFKQAMTKEIGDCMWYISQLCNELGLDLGAIMAFNLEKLTDRKERGTITGSGDDR